MAAPFDISRLETGMMMESSQEGSASKRVVASAITLQHAIQNRTKNIQPHTPASCASQLPRPCSSRLAATQQDRPYDVDEFAKDPPKDGTVLYLAYGSNLSSEKFKGDRGITPLTQINVQVPKLRMTFDLPGIPYAEPCFANSARRDPDSDARGRDAGSEKTPLLSKQRKGKGYRKDRWHKGLIGVVYEVTAEDYAHIIATEGGGASYQDILVDCYPLPTSNPRDPVPQNPDTTPFKAHTLFAPAVPEGEEPPKDGGRFQRPDPSYAQASARYLKLITDGAAECELPFEYQEYLRSIRPFTITKNRQRLGQFVFTAVWVPIVFALFALSRLVAGKNGTVPGWMKKLLSAVFQAAWTSYDRFFKPLFGEGERTIGDNVDHEEDLSEELAEKARSGHEASLEKATAHGNRPM